MKSFSQSDVKFDFGKKHNGKKMSQVPDSYLTWVFENCDIDDGLRDMIKREMMRRTKLDIVVEDDNDAFDRRRYGIRSLVRDKEFEDGLPF